MALSLLGALVLGPADRAPGQVLRDTTFTNPPGEVRNLAFAPDGEMLASIGADQRAKFAYVRLWDVKTGKEKSKFKLQTRRSGFLLAFTPDGKSLVSSCGQPPRPAAPGFMMIEVWDLEAGKRRLAIKAKGQGSKGGIGGDGKTLVVTARDASVALYDLQTGKELAVLSGHDGVQVLAVSKDGKWLATGCSKGKLGIWDLDKRKLLHLFDAHKGRITGLSFRPDGKQIATVGYDRWLNVWDRATGGREAKVSLDLHLMRPESLHFTPDGGTLVLSGTDRGEAIIWWESAGGRLRGSLEPPRGAKRHEHRCAALSPNGKVLATVNNTTIQLWELREKPKAP